MSTQRWFPLGHETLHHQIEKSVLYAVANAARFSIDKTTLLGEWFNDVFLVKYYAYDAGFKDFIDPTKSTPLVISMLKTLEKEIIPLYRMFNKMMSGNPLVADGDLEAMGLPPHPSGERKPSPVADLAPLFYIAPIEGHRLRVFYYAEGTERGSAKPRGQNGAEIRWGFSEEVVTDASILHESTLDTSSPCTITFRPSDAGKIVNIALRWENTRGEKGPWSVIMRVGVP